MARFDEQIYRRSLQVPLTTRLSFETVPTSRSDPPGRVASNQENRPYLDFRSWVEYTLEEFNTTILPIGHKDADGRRRANLKKLEYQLQRLDKILSWSWDHAKIQARVPGYYVLSDSKTAKLVPPRAWSGALSHSKLTGRI